MKKLFTLLIVILATANLSFADNTIFHWKGAKEPVSEGGSVSLTPIKLNKLKDYVKFDYYALQFSPKQSTHCQLSVDGTMNAGDTLIVAGFIKSSNDHKATLQYSIGTESPATISSDFANLFYDEDNPQPVGEPTIQKVVIPDNVHNSKSLDLSLGATSETSLYLTEITVKKKIVVPQITFISFENGSKVDQIKENSTLAFSTNFDEKCQGFKVSIVDAVKNTILYSDFTTDYNEGQWELTLYQAFDLIKDRKYNIILEGHEANSVKSPVVNIVSSYIIGNGTAYEFSDVKLSSVSPSAESIIKSVDDNIIHAIFSNEVQIDKEKSVILTADGQQVKLASIESKDNKDWTLTIPTSVLKNCTSNFKLLIYAKDNNGLALEGNEGEQDASHFVVNYKCFLGMPNVSISPKEGELESIKDFTYSFADGLSLVDDNNDNRITLYSNNKTTVVYKYQTRSNEENSAVSVKETAITTSGTYYLHIPAGKFLLGREEYPCQEMWVKYVIPSGELPSEVISTTPEQNAELEELKSITVKFSDLASPRNGNYTPKVYDEAGNIVATAKGEAVEDFVIKFTLSSTIRKAGTYRLVIPAEGLIWGYMGNTKNPNEISLTYKVKEGAEPVIVVNETPKNNSTVAALYAVVLSFDNNLNADAVKSPVTTSALYKNGQKIKDVQLLKGSNWNQIYVQITEDENSAITEAGTYTLVIPAGNIRLDGSFNYDKELTYTFVVDPTYTGLDIVKQMTNNVEVKVYNMQGMLIKKGTKASALEGLKGIYIVNGKKVVLK